jgi:alpha-beta hydrolase superfamily lysophospholipase
VETHLGRFPTQIEVPEPLKFAWPIVVLPELFTTMRHLATLVGYFATIGWEVYAPDLHAVIEQRGTPPLEKIDFANLTEFAAEAVAAIGREVIVVGHGIGGLVALKLGERSGVKAAVAIAPLAPGFRTPLFMRRWNFLSAWQHRPLNPPTRRTLFEFVADADVHSRPQIIKMLTPGETAAALQVVKGEIAFAAEKTAPRLIVAGESDIFAPYEELEQFAHRIGAPIVKIPGRGHWLIGGRGLERAINEIQRFLVRSLGRDLLLLYPEEWKRED